MNSDGKNGIEKTKDEFFMELREIVKKFVEDETKRNELINFIDKRIDELEKRRINAASRGKKKKVQSDALAELILAQISNKLMTVDEILVSLDDIEITRHMVIARLGRLLKEGALVKDYVKVNKKRKTAYKLAPGVEYLPADDDKEEYYYDYDE